MKLIVNTPEETLELGKALGKLLEKGDLISLEGDLGAGKTQFTKGVGMALGINEIEITSPTFTLINEYDGSLTLYHFDVYRIEVYELDDLGYEEYFYGDGVCLIEWGNTIREYLPDSYLQIVITKTAENQRELNFNAIGERYVHLLSELKVVIE